MPEGESRTHGTEGQRELQHNIRRDATFPPSAFTAMPNPSALRVSSYSVSHHAPLNSDGDCEQQIWEARYPAGVSRQTLPTISDINTEAGPPVPPESPPFVPLATPRSVRLSASQLFVRPISAISVNEQAPPYISPENPISLSPGPALSQPLNPFAPQRRTQPPSYSEAMELLVSQLVDGDIARRFFEEIRAAQSELDKRYSWLSWSTESDMDETPSITETQDHARPLSQPPIPCTTPFGLGLDRTRVSIMLCPVSSHSCPLCPYQLVHQYPQRPYSIFFNQELDSLENRES